GGNSGRRVPVCRGTATEASIRPPAPAEHGSCSAQRAAVFVAQCKIDDLGRAQADIDRPDLIAGTTIAELELGIMSPALHRAILQDSAGVTSTGADCSHHATKPADVGRGQPACRAAGSKAAIGAIAPAFDLSVVQQ